MKVKICGIRSLENAQVAIDAGADFLGFNFVASSNRYIEQMKAKAVIQELRSKNYESSVKIVGVFQNQSVTEVNEITEMLGLDFVQLHGEEDEIYMGKIQASVIKKLVISTKVERSSATELIDQLKPAFPGGGVRFLDFARNDKVEYFLLDREMQGIGEMVDLEKAKEIAKKLPIFFAGGLTPENVSDAAAKVRPFAVDVASGVETDGFMDSEKVKEFIKNAKGITV